MRVSVGDRGQCMDRAGLDPFAGHGEGQIASKCWLARASTTSANVSFRFCVTRKSDPVRSETMVTVGLMLHFYTIFIIRLHSPGTIYGNRVFSRCKEALSALVKTSNKKAYDGPCFDL
jgi:hypothetical protein